MNGQSGGRLQLSEATRRKITTAKAEVLQDIDDCVIATSQPGKNRMVKAINAVNVMVVQVAAKPPRSPMIQKTVTEQQMGSK